MQRHKKHVLAAEEIRRCQKFGQVRIIWIQWLFPSFCLTCQMLIARLAPTVHVHLLKHGGIASKGHCIAFPQAVQEPATILPRLPAEVDIIRVRRQGKDDTHKDFRVRRHRVEGALRWLKDNNPAYGDVIIDGARIENLPEDGELPNLRTVEFSETERVDDQGPAPQQLDTGGNRLY